MAGVERQRVERGQVVIVDVATVNSDDPAYFGGYVYDNYLAAFDALPLDAGHARQLAKNSFSAAFLEPERKRAYLAEVDAFFDAA